LAFDRKSRIRGWEGNPMTAYEIRAANEDERDRLELLHRYTSSTRFALTEADVLYDMRSGRNRYRPFDKQADVEPFDVQADWEERS
jgi:hypothetical protein